MALHPVDRDLLNACLAHEPGSWERFVNRFLGLVCHVIHHTARCRSIQLQPQDFDDLAAEVFLAIIENDYAVLRRFRAQSSLATYLTVIARRVVVRELLKRKTHINLSEMNGEVARGNGHSAASEPSAEERISDREEIERLLTELEESEAQVVRMYHLEGKTYEEISSMVGMPANSVGPTLSRARAKMRRLVE